MPELLPQFFSKEFSVSVSDMGFRETTANPAGGRMTEPESKREVSLPTTMKKSVRGAGFESALKSSTHSKLVKEPGSLARTSLITTFGACAKLGTDKSGMQRKVRAASITRD